jgi:uncharacterized membrane protein YadS
VKKFVIPTFALAFILGSLVCAILDLNNDWLIGMGFDWNMVKVMLSGTILPFMFATAFTGVGSKVLFKSILSLGIRPLLLTATVTITAALISLFASFLLVPYIMI